MKKSKWGSAVIFPVNDVRASIDWYVDYLGFESEFEWEDPVSYAVLNLKGVQIHLTKTDNPDELQGRLYMFSPDVDAYYEDIQNRGLILKVRPEEQEYGMKDFEIEDPSGNQLIIGTGI